MFETLLTETPWVALALGLIVYVADYALLLYEAYLYHTSARPYLLCHDIYEFSSGRPDDPPWRRLIQPTFLLRLLVVGAGIPLVWWAAVRELERPEIVLVLVGGLVLLKAATAIRHLRQAVFYQHMRREEAVEGAIEYAEALVLTGYVVELYGFTVLYALLTLTGSPWFFLGGAITCFVTSRRMRDYVRLREARPDGPAE